MDARLARLSRICLAHTGAVREDCGRHAWFHVRKRTFAWFLDDHHGDGIVGVAAKVLPGDNQALVKAHPKRFYLPAYVHSRGWVGLRLDTPKVDWAEVAEIVATSYALIAPKKRSAAHPTAPPAST